VSLFDFLFGRIIDGLVDGRVPILTVLARKLTGADEKDAKIAASLLTDQALADEMAKRNPFARDPWTRALAEEALRRGK